MTSTRVLTERSTKSAYTSSCLLEHVSLSWVDEHRDLGAAIDAGKVAVVSAFVYVKADKDGKENAAIFARDHSDLDCYSLEMHCNLYRAIWHIQVKQRSYVRGEERAVGET